MEKSAKNSRREFLQKLLAATAVAGIYPYLDTVTGNILMSGYKGKMPVRPLGKTGHMVCIYSLGGQATIETPGKEDLSVQIINRAIDLGINYIDTAAGYGRATATIPKAEARGHSERNIGQVMKTRRNEVFLASKTDDRTYDGSMRLLEKSLKNLQTDHLDLWQVHNLTKAQIADVDKYFAADGVIKAMEKARNEKMVRFVGITGHESPAMLKIMAERYPSIMFLLRLMPLTSTTILSSKTFFRLLLRKKWELWV
ncbi:MAG: aldo/keto reductase [Bacteroidales bacterium]|nr:aldo/keto reductase [Bacteroidales bacterium]